MRAGASSSAVLLRHGLIEYIRRDIATKAEFEHYLRIWGRRRYGDYQLGYLAFHGKRGKAVLLDDHDLTLAELGRMLGKHRVRGDKIIHLASCYGLRVPEDQLARFLESSKAWVVSGYSKEVETIEAAALEALLFQEFEGTWRNAAQRYREFEAKYPELIERLGFVWRAAE